MRRIAAIAVAATLGGTVAAQAAEPIEGTWNYNGGAVLVEATGPGTFKGTVTKVTQFASCPHPVGQTMWQMTGSGLLYTGTHIYYNNSDCSAAGGGQSRWQVDVTDPNNPMLRFCSNNPGNGPPTFDPTDQPTGATDCTKPNLTRLAPPQPPPTFAQAVTLPKATKKCRSKRKITIHVRQGNDPFVRGVYKLNGKVVKTLIGQDKVSAPVNLRGLAKGRYTVAITLTTATGKTVDGSRRYRTCTPKRH